MKACLGLVGAAGIGCDDDPTPAGTRADASVDADSPLATGADGAASAVDGPIAPEVAARFAIRWELCARSAGGRREAGGYEHHEHRQAQAAPEARPVRFELTTSVFEGRWSRGGEAGSRRPIVYGAVSNLLRTLWTRWNGGRTGSARFQATRFFAVRRPLVFAGFTSWAASTMARSAALMASGLSK